MQGTSRGWREEARLTPEIFAEWLRRMGHRVVRTRSSYWFDLGPRLLQAFPYHCVIQPSESELMQLLRGENALGLRYSTPIEAPQGACSYHIVSEHASYTLQDVESSVRAKVRRGLEACTVGPISMDRYARESWALEQDTHDRQGRHTRHGRVQWERMLESAAGLEGFEAWGAEVDGRLAASLLFVQVDGCVDMLYQQSRREFLPLRVNNALLFDVTRSLVARPGIQLIHNGLHSLDAPASVDQFKLRHGYRAKALRQRVVFHPSVDPLVGDGTSLALSWLAKIFPAREFLQKSNGLVRFYRNGLLPLARQPFPMALASEREGLCRRAGGWALDPS